MEVRANESMARHVTWRAGGPVAKAAFPHDLNDLAAFMATLRHDEPLLMVGLGSNLLIRDGGFDGTAIFTHGALATLQLEADGTLYAEAGVASPKIARFAANHHLSGAEFLAGIPGTRRRAGDECGLPWQRDMGLRRARAHAGPARRTDRPHAG